MVRIALVVLLIGCSRDTPSADRADRLPCESAQRVGALPAELREASGVAISRRHPGILWVHNDSGDPTLFAIDTAGNVRARVDLDLPNLDWEDIDIGPCPQGDCLYIGAIGDNRQNRTDREIMRLQEPALNARSARVTERFRYQLDEPHDAEAFFVMPDERIYLITKGRSGPVTLYRFPDSIDVDGSNQLQPVQQLTPGLVQLPDMVTGAAASPDGHVVVVRTYSALQLYRLEHDQLKPIADTSGFDLQPLREPQGEGVDIRADGIVFLVSEQGLEQQSAPLSRVQCSRSAP